MAFAPPFSVHSGEMFCGVAVNVRPGGFALFVSEDEIDLFRNVLCESREIFFCILNGIRMAPDRAIGRRQVEYRFSMFLGHRYQASIIGTLLYS